MVALFTELAVILVITFIISLVTNKIKQPLLIAYIITGIIAGPIFFNLLSTPEHFEIFSHIGIAFLLFIVGLQLNISLVKEVGKISIITGIGQIVFTTVFGLGISMLLGMSFMEAALISLALTFSSTIIIVKLLSDSGGLSQLYGKISLGFLLVQDFVAVLILMIVGTLATKTDSANIIYQTIFFGIVSIVVIFTLIQPLLTKLQAYIADQKELTFIFILAWCFGVSIFFQFLGFPLEIGALIAGVSLASTPYQQDVLSRIKPLRDFFIILFFVFLGSQLIPTSDLLIGNQWEYIAGTLGPIVPQAIILSLFVLLGNPLIVLLLVSFSGYSSRTGFLAGLTVSQISEFSIILVLLASNAGFLSPEHVSLITLVAIITITCSTYLVVYGERIYDKLKPLLRKLEHKQLKDARQGLQGKKHKIGIFGYRRIGPHVLSEIKKTKQRYLIVDHDPRIIRKLKQQKIECVFGDVSSMEFLSEFDFKDMKLVISTIPNAQTNKALLVNYRRVNKRGVIVLTVSEPQEAVELYDLGANYVIVPHHLGAHHIEQLLKEFAVNRKRFHQERKRHITQLSKEKSYSQDANI
ncbi:MAG: Kef-type K+ transport system membrane component KefB/Trk K+ transport system NAD-binding subunit [Candidatus Woesearchaeota archaeon]|jgi:Kef-type K+ transport system membrane component KefB/Trk K+ transport system NAD-binding subunit